MHDPTSLFRFEEHDIYLPMLTLEELDNNKKGMTRSRAQRAAGEPLPRRARHRDGETGESIDKGIPLEAQVDGAATGRLFLQTETITTAVAGPRSRAARPTTRSSASSLHLAQAHPKRSVILVSKDINMRIKARALGMAAEDYFNDKVLEDTELLYSGIARAAGRLLGPPRQGHGVLAAGRPHVLPRDGAAGPVAAASTSSSTTRRRTRRRSTRSSRRSTARPRCCRRSRTTRTRRTTCGASPRATASRTSR